MALVSREMARLGSWGQVPRGQPACLALGARSRVGPGPPLQAPNPAGLSLSPGAARASEGRDNHGRPSVDSQARAGSQEGSAFLRGETSPTSLPGPEAGASLTRVPSTARSLCRCLGRGDPVHTSFFLLAPEPPLLHTDAKEKHKRENLHKLNSLMSCFIFKLFGSSQLYMATSALAVERKKTYKPRLWLERRSERTVLGRGAWGRGCSRPPGAHPAGGSAPGPRRGQQAAGVPLRHAVGVWTLPKVQLYITVSERRVCARVRRLAGAGPGRRLC